MASRALHEIEQEGSDTAKLAALIARAIVHRHLQTMLRLDIQYDLLPKESDIIHLHAGIARSSCSSNPAR